MTHQLFTIITAATECCLISANVKFRRHQMTNISTKIHGYFPYVWIKLICTINRFCFYTCTHIVKTFVSMCICQWYPLSLISIFAV